VRRPDPLRWWWYAVGGGLPLRYREWVLHDLTTGTWRLRQMFRSVVQVLPVSLLVVIFLPGDLWVRVLAAAGGLCVSMIYALAYLDEATEHRALKAGYPRGTVRAVRDEADADGREAAAVRYGQRYRGEPPAATRRSSE
jgi:hypothetical protein